MLLNDVVKGYMEVDDMWILGYDGYVRKVGITE